MSLISLGATSLSRSLMPGRMRVSETIQTSLLSTQTEQSSALVIPAANSVLAKKIIPTALRQGISVFAFTGEPRKSLETFGMHPNLSIIPTAHQAYTDSQTIKKQMRIAFKDKQFSTLGIVNTLGGTTSALGRPDSPKELFEKNVKAPRGFTSGVIEAASDHAEAFHVVNLSSIAASISDPKKCNYAHYRLAGEDEISDVASKKAKVTHLRLGLVQATPIFDPKTNKWVVDSGHNHSAENWAGKKIVFVAGEDKNPVYQPTSIGCITKGILRSAFRTTGPDVRVIDAVSRHLMTQREYLTLFTKGKILCVHVPLEILQHVAQLSTDGRLQPYALQIISALEKEPKVLDSSEFEKLIGEPALTMDALYAPVKDSSFIRPGIQLARYTHQLLKESVSKPKKSAQLLKALAESKGWQFSVIERS
ncbi:MAG: hypothetical protein K2P51_04915 [Rhabdochlamydiaceae bacterium]|nr:hypothetical protein [Rhabdochlamydiaceae bacterium]